MDKKGVKKMGVCDDLISRQAAIDAILEDKIDDRTLGIICALGDGLQAQTLNDTCDRHAQIIKALPTAQNVPDRKVGKWVEEDDAIIHGHCSNCGWLSIWQETDVFGMKFCPNCGAEMRKETEDDND